LPKYVSHLFQKPNAERQTHPLVAPLAIGTSPKFKERWAQFNLIKET
jgi:hypothetical protein